MEDFGLTELFDAKSELEIKNDNSVLDKDRCLHIFLTGRWTDCSFEVGSVTKEVFKAHKLFLSISSQFFENLFYGAKSNSCDEVIQVPDVDPKIFRIMLEYVYGGKESISQMTSFDDIYALYVAAKKYSMLYLVTRCSKMLCCCIDSAKACEAYELAKTYNDRELMAASVKVIQTSTKLVLENPSFVKACYDTLLEILDMDFITISSETVLYNALYKWISHFCEENNMELNCDAVEKMVAPALAKIDFASMAVGELIMCIDECPFFTYEEKFSLVKRKMVPSKNCPLPSKVSPPRTISRSLQVGGVSKGSWCLESVRKDDDYVRRGMNGYLYPTGRPKKYVKNHARK